MIDEPVSVTSLAPTILDLLGLEIPESFPHGSLVPLLNGSPGDAAESRVVTEVDFVPILAFNRKKTVKQ